MNAGDATILDRLAAELTPRQYEVLVLREVHRLSFPTIGLRLGISWQAAHQAHAGALRRARQINWEGIDA